MRTIIQRIRTGRIIGICWCGLILSCATAEKSTLVPPSPQLDSVSCVAILPFENLSGFPEAGNIVSDILATELYSTQRFNILEWQEALSSLTSAGMSIPDYLGAETAQSLAQFLGVEAVLIGVVSDFSYGTTLMELRAGLPNIAFTARLIDAKSGDPLWASAISLGSSEFMEPRRQSINHLAQVAAAAMVDSLVPGQVTRPVDRKTICWQKVAATAPRPKPAAAPAVPTQQRRAPARPKVKPKIAVLNASGIEGLEENVGLILLMKNWDVATLAKYPYKRTFPTTTIYCRNGYEPEARKIEGEIPGPQKVTTTEKMAKDVHITILVGKDQAGQ